MTEKPYLLITRPREEAEAFATLVSGTPYQRVIEPLMEMVVLNNPPPPPHYLNPHPDNDSSLRAKGEAIQSLRTDRASGKAGLPRFARNDNNTSLNTSWNHIILTSPRALSGLATCAITPNAACYVVGKATAEALREAGFTNIQAIGKTVEELLAQIAAIAPSLKEKSSSWLYIRSQHIQTDIAAALKPYNLDIQEYIAYDMRLAGHFSPKTLEILQSTTPALVTFFSARTANHFCTLMDKHGLNDYTHLHAICISPQVAKVIRHHHWSSITTATKPDVAHMVRSITFPSPPLGGI